MFARCQGWIIVASVSGKSSQSTGIEVRRCDLSCSGRFRSMACAASRMLSVFPNNTGGVFRDACKPAKSARRNFSSSAWLAVNERRVCLPSRRLQCHVQIIAKPTLLVQYLCFGGLVLRVSGEEPSRLFFFVASEHRDNVIHGDNEQLVVVFKVNGDRVFGVEQDLVVLS